MSLRHGHISGQGRAALAGQAAQTAKRSPEFSTTYAAISKRRGKKIATIAIARKLLTRAYHLLAAEALRGIRRGGLHHHTPASREGHQAPGTLVTAA